jgi:hypothetical protein
MIMKNIQQETLNKKENHIYLFAFLCQKLIWHKSTLGLGGSARNNVDFYIDTIR